MGHTSINQNSLLISQLILGCKFHKDCWKDSNYPTLEKGIYCHYGMCKGIFIDYRRHINFEDSLTDNFLICTLFILDCNQEIFTSDVEIKSPNYPKNFPTEIECKYVIKTNKTKRLRITFLDFRLPFEDENCDCIK